MDFEIQSVFNAVHNRWDVILKGEVDIYNSEEMKKDLIALLSEHANDLYIKCDELMYLDSTGLGSLVSVLKKVKQYNCSIHLINLRSNVLKTFRITDLDKVFLIEGETND